MPRIAQERMDERRAAIVAAAMRLFARDGLANVSLRDIFAEAGLSAGAVYNYFSSREEIVQAAATAGMAGTIHSLESIANAAAPGEKLARTVDFFVDVLESLRGSDVPRLEVMVGAEAMANTGLGEALTRHRAEIRTILARALRADGRRNPHTATMLLAVFDGLMLAIALGEDFDVRAARRQLRAIIAA